MENIETKKEHSISKPLLISGIILSVAGLLYIAYISIIVPDIIEYKAYSWYMVITAIDFLSTLALAVLTMLAVFKITRLKYLSIPILAFAAINIFTIVYSIIQTGISAIYAYTIFSKITLAAALILFGIYAIRKNISIVFATIFTTIFSVFELWYNSEELASVISSSLSLGAIFYYSTMILFAVGVLFLVWSCCIFYAPKAKDRDIIKKNIPLSVVLSVITLGVYAVFWVRSITDDIAKLEGGEVNSSFETALFFIIPFYAIFWLYKTGQKSAKLAKDADMSKLFIVHAIFLLCFFSLALIQHQIHMAVGLEE